MESATAKTNAAREPAPWPIWVRYLVTLLVEVALTMSLLLFHTYIPDATLRTPYLLAIALIAYFLGMGPAILGIVLTTAGYLIYAVMTGSLLWPPGASPGQWAAFIIFALSTIAIAAGALLIRRAERRSRLLLERVQASESIYRLLFENMNEIMTVYQIVYDANGNAIDLIFLDVNPTFEASTGLPREKVIGKRLTLVFGLEKPPEAFFGPYVQVAQTRQPARFEALFAPYGRHYIVSAFPLGKDRIAMVSTDITERKRAEEEARTNEVFLRQVLDSLPVGVWVTDRSGRIIQANPEGINIWGGARYVGIEQFGEYKGWLLDTGESIKPDEWGAARAILKGETTLEEEIEIEAFDGTHKIILSSAKPLRGPDNELLGAIAVNQDITERKRYEQLSESLNRINAAINSTLETPEVMNRVMIEVSKATGANASAILLREKGQWVVHYTYGFVPPSIGTRFTDDEARISTVVSRTHQLLYIEDTATDPRVDPTIMQRYGIQSIMALPLITRNEAIGVLILNYQRTGMHFSNAQIDFANKVAASVSLALENARLYASQRGIADTLQEALLRVPDRIPGLEIGHRYNSASEAARVGGDFYDLIELEGERVGIVVGDAAGKGLEAATITSLIRNAIRAYAYQENSPAHVIALVNEVIRRAPEFRSFATVFFGILEVTTGRLVYCNAGHPSGMIHRASAETSLLPANSPIIGAFPNLAYSENEEILREGDTLIVYTDGITEARRGMEFFGEEGLAEFLREQRSLPAKEAPDRIFTKVLEFTGGTLSDDIALLAVSRSGAPDNRET